MPTQHREGLALPVTQRLVAGVEQRLVRMRAHAAGLRGTPDALPVHLAHGLCERLRQFAIDAAAEFVVVAEQ
ncbi:MAG: hypothetical protein EA346_00020, partial [Thioalkalivibrio sp.]